MKWLVALFLAIFPPVHEIKPGAQILSLDLAAVNEIALARSNAERAERWTARFVKRVTTVSQNGDNWDIASAPEGASLLDRQAESKFLSHLVDTLGTLTWAQAAPRGGLESFGLAPPRFSLTLTQSNGVVEKFDLGDFTQLPDGGRVAYARVIRNDAYGPVGYVRGAALEMLTMITSFPELRNRTLVDFDLDDVDEAEVFKKGKKLAYAQRHGNGWADARHRPLDFDFGAQLEAISHLRVLAYEDDAERAKQLRKRVITAPDFLIRLKRRRGAAIEIRAARAPSGLWALITSRPQAVVQLYDTAIQHLEPAKSR